MHTAHQNLEAEVEIPFSGFHLDGELIIPPRAVGVAIFAHGSGSSRHSPRNQFVARTLREHAVGTLLFDLLTLGEEQADEYGGRLRFDIDLLAERLLGATDWCHEKEPDFPIGYFGSSTGGAAALVAAVRSRVPIQAIVSRGGRPDLAGPALSQVGMPTLLIVGEDDLPVRELNEEAYEQLRGPRDLQLVAGATHLFEEPGALEQVAEMAAEWFEQYFGKRK